jgi:hypothetical protein
MRRAYRVRGCGIFVETTIGACVGGVERISYGVRTSIESGVPDYHEKTALLEKLASLPQANDKPTFLKRSKQFLGLVTTCTQLAPHLAHWSQTLTELTHHHGF